MPQALITSKPNELRSIEVWDISAIQGWYRLGIWQWLAWNHLKFFSKLLSKFTARQQRLTERRNEQRTKRDYLKHYGYLNVFRLYAMLTLWASERRTDGILQYARKLLCPRTLAHSLRPPSYFCRGLTGFARTDVVVRLLIF